ncbi:sigma-54-dependent Fis family transcriptional regulator [candidate division FCPU426 bacterium]|nr:sigma-54-dependent Fis family transcriptional regulator [candidate division FCPU426 bacterium]
MTQEQKVLIVDDEPEHCMVISRALGAAGYNTQIANDGSRAIDLSRQNHFDLYLLDIRMQPLDGIQVLQEIRNLYPDSQAIMLSALGDVDVAVKCMKLGAYDFLSKPVNLDELLITVSNAMKSIQLQQEVQSLRSQIQIQQSTDHLLGESPKMQELLKAIEQVSRHDITVMIRGESGTGKELAARALHASSRRATAPFVSVDCATLPETLVESELFGYERGAFTGASGRKIGRFEQAANGTLFMDEIGNLNVNVQVKLLRVLQERKFRRLGGKEELPFAATIITATNVNLERAIREGTFREDLYYRLNEFVLRIPPLRERREDIPLLVKHLLDMFNRKFEKTIRDVSPEVLHVFLHYQWPGNVREMKNIIKRAVVLADDIIEIQHLPEQQVAQPEPAAELKGSTEKPSATGTSLKDIVKYEMAKLECRVIKETLEACHWNRTNAAKKLEIDYKTLYNKMKEYDIG